MKEKIMASQFPSAQHHSKPPINDCYTCRLRETDSNGHVSCFMEAVRDKWEDPHAEYYCADIYTKKYVNHFNKKTVTESVAPVIFRHHRMRLVSRRKVKQERIFERRVTAERRA
jgi:hypothetical protein